MVVKREAKQLILTKPPPWAKAILIAIVQNELIPTPFTKRYSLYLRLSASAIAFSANGSIIL
jgi:hypothetical protein